MTLSLGLALQGRLREFLEEEVRETSQAVRVGVKDSTEAVKLGARDEIAQRLSSGQRKGGSNRRVANAIRSRLFDDGPFDQAGIVYSKFGRGRGASFVDYLAPHVLGAEITPVSRQALLIAFGKTKGTRRKRRNEIQRREGLAFIRLDRDRTLIVRKGRGRRRGTPIGLFLRRVRIRPKLNFDRIIRRETDALPRRILNFLGP